MAYWLLVITFEKMENRFYTIYNITTLNLCYNMPDKHFGLLFFFFGKSTGLQAKNTNKSKLLLQNRLD